MIHLSAACLLPAKAAQADPEAAPCRRARPNPHPAAGPGTVGGSGPPGFWLAPPLRVSAPAKAWRPGPQGARPPGPWGLARHALPPSLLPSLRPSFHPSFPPSFPPSLLPSLPPCALPTSRFLPLLAPQPQAHRRLPGKRSLTLSPLEEGPGRFRGRPGPPAVESAVPYPRKSALMGLGRARARARARVRLQVRVRARAGDGDSDTFHSQGS